MLNLIMTKKHHIPFHKRLINKFNSFGPVLSFAGAIAYGTYYVATYELRLSNVESQERYIETKLDEINKKIDAIYDICNKAKYIRLLGGIRE